MSLRRLEALQWLGLFAGAATWVAQHAVGLGTAYAECSPGGSRWGVDNTVWEATMMGLAVLFVLGAETAAVVVFSQTRGADFGDGPPEEDRFGGVLPYTRLHFFAAASMAANGVFLVIILLDGFASIFDVVCRQG